jgi:hypothetical protein
MKMAGWKHHESQVEQLKETKGSIKQFGCNANRQ